MMTQIDSFHCDWLIGYLDVPFFIIFEIITSSQQHRGLHTGTRRPTLKKWSNSMNVEVFFSTSDDIAKRDAIYKLKFDMKNFNIQVLITIIGL